VADLVVERAVQTTLAVEGVGLAPRTNLQQVPDQLTVAAQASVVQWRAVPPVPDVDVDLLPLNERPDIDKSIQFSQREKKKQHLEWSNFSPPNFDSETQE
jgi:hypothetical protein